jgi:hypothetical protein
MLVKLLEFLRHRRYSAPNLPLQGGKRRLVNFVMRHPAVGAQPMFGGLMIEEITPKHLRCPWGQCVSVYRLEDGNLLIIGKDPSPQVAEKIAEKVASDEKAVVISPEYLSELFSKTP